jgi:beta-xylosidase
MKSASSPQPSPPLHGGGGAKVANSERALKTDAPAEVLVDDWKQVFLRAEVDCQRLQFSASPDGRNWQNIGPVLDSSKLSDDYGAGLHFTGAMVGLCAQDVGGWRTPADFDYFDYQFFQSAETRHSSP